jgi:hypothetical protein
MWQDWSMLAVRQLSLRGGRALAPRTPDLSLLHGIVAEGVISAMRVASEVLTRLEVRHTLVGGLAVGAYGYPRATKVVDFLVGQEAFEHQAGGVVTMKPGVPVQVGGVAIAFVSIGDNESHLEAALLRQVADAPVLVYLKLKSPRSRDRASRQ